MNTLTASRELFETLLLTESDKFDNIIVVEPDGSRTTYKGEHFYTITADEARDIDKDQSLLQALFDHGVDTTSVYQEALESMANGE